MGSAGGGGTLSKVVISNSFGDDPGTNTMMTINTINTINIFGNRSTITKSAINNSFGDTIGTTTITTSNPFCNQSRTNTSTSIGLFQHTIYLVMMITMVIRQYTLFISLSYFVSIRILSKILVMVIDLLRNCHNNSNNIYQIP